MRIDKDTNVTDKFLVVAGQMLRRLKKTPTQEDVLNFCIESTQFMFSLTDANSVSIKNRRGIPPKTLRYCYTCKRFRLFEYITILTHSRCVACGER